MIEKYRQKYMVRASRGHLRDLPKSQFGIDVEHGWSKLTSAGESSAPKG